MVGAFAFLRSFGFSTFQLSLTKLCRLCGISARLQGGFLEKIAPALMPIRGVLVAFEFLQGRLCVRSSLEHLDHSRGLISADVVAYDNVRSLEFVVCQILSPLQPETKTLL